MGTPARSSRFVAWRNGRSIATTTASRSGSVMNLTGASFRFRVGVVPSEATAPLGASTACFRDFSDEDNLKADLLKCQLVTGASEESHRPLRRLEGCAQLNADGFPEKMGKVILHFAVQNEGDVGIELFLQLKELQLAMLPGACFKHGEHKDVLAGVMREGIQQAGPLDSGSGRRTVCAAPIFAEGNQT